jgi:hypothetical protein
MMFGESDHSREPVRGGEALSSVRDLAPLEKGDEAGSLITAG